MMRVRPTVRVVLFDPLDRVLLIRAMDGRIDAPAQPDRERVETFWALAGGEMNLGESLHEAARRELHRETGLTSVTVGRPVLEREQAMELDGEPVFFQETYLIGRTHVTAISWGGILDAAKGDVFREHRWWTLAELRATTEAVLPEGLADLVANLTGAIRS